MLVVLVVAIQPPTIPVGVYAGYALDENALTDLLFRRWLTDAFFVQITDAPTVAALVPRCEIAVDTECKLSNYYRFAVMPGVTAQILRASEDVDAVCRDTKLLVAA